MVKMTNLKQALSICTCIDVLYCVSNLNTKKNVIFCFHIHNTNSTHIFRLHPNQIDSLSIIFLLNNKKNNTHTIKIMWALNLDPIIFIFQLKKYFSLVYFHTQQLSSPSSSSSSFFSPHLLINQCHSFMCSFFFSH